MNEQLLTLVIAVCCPLIVAGIVGVIVTNTGVQKALVKLDTLIVFALKSVEVLDKRTLDHAERIAKLEP